MVWMAFAGNCPGKGPSRAPSNRRVRSPRRCVVNPEFPTGNGKVDLHLKCRDRQGVIEVKSFKSLSKAKAAWGQAARYAKSLSLDRVTVAMFTPAYDDAVLEKLSGKEILHGVAVRGERRCNRRSHRHWMALKR